MSERGGYVRIYRSLWDHPDFRDGTEAGAFAWMIAQAAWRPTTVRYKDRRIDLQRAQLATSFRDIAGRFTWSKTRAERFIGRLKTGTMIETATGTGVLVITICNYDQYQPTPEMSGTGDGTTVETGPGQQRDTAGTQNKEEKESKNVRKEIPTLSLPLGAPSIDQAVSLWNEMASDLALAQVQKLTTKRRSALSKRLAECAGIEGWRAALGKIRTSSYAQGRSPAGRGWKITFDFTVSPDGFAKLMEGHYDDRPISTSSNGGWAADALRRGMSGADDHSGPTIDAEARQ